MSMLRRITPSILVLLISEVLLILLFPGSLIFESNLTAGGDTPSHFMAAVAMSRGWFTFFSPVTWIHGAFAGFPLFLNYFPMPFALMALISRAVSLQIAFKLVTLLAIIPLPAAVYLCLRYLGYGQNTRAIGAVLSLPFLLMTENSMWGANLDSTLSGEFAYGISFILYVVFTGKVYADITGRKSPLGCSILEALTAVSNGYPLVQSVMATSYFILWGGNLRYLLQLHAAAAGFAAFWLLPLLWRIPWNTPYGYSWHFESWTQIAPPVLWPSIAGALIVAFSGIRNLFRQREKFSAIFKESIDCAELYLFWQFAIALFCFCMAPFLKLVDIRFLPFAQITMALLGAVGWSRLLSRLPRPNLWLAGFCTAVIALTLTKAPAVDSWIRWNYSGMESKPLWNTYLMMNEYLSGDENSPRVFFEYNDTITNNIGSSRAFELLPHFSGRSTLEGLYLQSGLNSPFVFYIQSELTQVPCSPFARYYYSRPNPGRAADHLRLFNVSQVIATTDNIANALDSSPDYELAMVFPPYRVYRLKGCTDSYVEPLGFRPLRIPPGDWRKVQFDWLRKSSLKVPLIVASKDSRGDFWKSLQPYDGNPERIPEVPIPEGEDIQAKATLSDGKITIDSSKPGHPLWIKVSYHPDWRITEGAGELYLASPGFMLLVPRTSRVVLTFDTGAGIYIWGKILFFLTILVFVIKAVICKVLRRKAPPRTVSGQDSRGAWTMAISWFHRIFGGRRQKDGMHTGRVESPAASPARAWNNAGFLAALVLVVAVLLGAISTRNHRDPYLLYELAAGKFERSEHDKSLFGESMSQDSPDSTSGQTWPDIKLLDECIGKFGHSSVLDHCMLYKAWIMDSMKMWGDLRPMLEKFLEDNPDNRIYAEGLAWMGKASLNMGQKEDAERFFRQALASWPDNNATRQAGLHLAEMTGADALLEDAKELLASGDYIRAYNIYRALALSADKKTAREGIICLAYCSFYMNRWQEASDLFVQWLNDNFDTPESARVQADFKQCQAIIAKIKGYMPGLEPGAASPAPSGLIVRFLNWAGEEMHWKKAVSGEK